MKNRKLRFALTVLIIVVASVAFSLLFICLLDGLYNCEMADWQRVLGFIALTLLPLLVYYVYTVLVFKKNQRSIKERKSIAGMDSILREWAMESFGADAEVHPVICQNCDNDSFFAVGDTNEGAAELECVSCGTKKKLLDSAEIWEECETEKMFCPCCEVGEQFNVRVGFLRRENGDLRAALIGLRCTDCHETDVMEWHIDYGPTADVEKNI